uniref:Reticulocyte-binding protein 2 a n=1 Tax=Lygus hesperus TaxID=30085 RepID=A0A146KZ88_LYGHE
MAGLSNVCAVFEETREVTAGFECFAKGLRKTIEAYSKAAAKRVKGPRAFVEPPFTMPVLPASIRASMSSSMASSAMIHDTPPGSKPGGRPARGAALRARQGVTESYKLMSQTKLRRPSNFSATKGLHPMPTIPATPDCLLLDGGPRSTFNVPAAVASSDEGIFRVPAPPPSITGPSRTDFTSTRNVTNDETDSESSVVRTSKRVRASKRKKTKKESQNHTYSKILIQETDPVEPMDNTEMPDTVEGEPLPVTASHSPMELPADNCAVERSESNEGNRTKIIRRSKPEEELASDEVDEVEQVAKPLKTRTKTLKKNKMETATNSTMVLSEANTDAVEVGDNTTSERTRTKTIRKNKPETASNSTMVLSETNTVGVEAGDSTTSERTRTKTIRKNKPVEETAESKKVDEGMAVNNDQPPEELSQKSKPCPKNTNVVLPSIDVDDPMDTLDFPPGMDGFTLEVSGSKKRSHDSRNNSDDVPGVKRRKPSETTVDDLIICQNAPRTRSKMKAIVESRSRSAETVRTPGQGKENSTVPVNLILQSFTGGVKHTTPLAPVNKLMISPKFKTTGSASRNKPARFIKDPARDVEKAKMAEARRKEEEALRKKQELMKLKQEEIRNQRETKVKKVTESRAAVEKEKLLQLEKEKKEREEKMKAARAEMMKLKEEERLRKKMLNQMKAQEAEERRLKDEQLRLAKLREQEEEQKKAAEARQRQEEEAERLAALRKQH